MAIITLQLFIMTGKFYSMHLLSYPWQPNTPLKLMMRYLVVTATHADNDHRIVISVCHACSVAMTKGEKMHVLC